jgi:putative colanic acid biosynthesis UDP-glucose lipid carrier transferase
MPDSAHASLSFRPAPPTIRHLVASVLEPAAAVLVFLAVVAWREPISERATFVLCVLIFALGFPAQSRFSQSPGQAARSIAVSWLGEVSILLLIGYALQSLDVAPLSDLLAWVVLTPFVQWLAVAVGHTLLEHQTARADRARTIVVIGAGPWGAHVADTLANRRDGRDRVNGFFDDRSTGRLHARAADRCLGGLKDAAEYVRANRVAEVHIALPLHEHARMRELIEQLEGTTASVFYIPDLTGIGVVQGRLEDRDGLPLVGLCETPFTGTNLLAKRVSDIVIASIVLVLIAPLMLMIAIGVKLSGPGPVIFRQRRNGLNGEEIVVYKFRSMSTLDDGAVIRQATRDDARLTRFGAFLRRTSLDELPQFINVLQGRMSVVGPRPHAVAHNEMYRDIVRAYMVRHKVRPGITGLAQVNGFRGETDTVEKMQARVKYDLEYLRKWSLALDLSIIARTIRLVMFDRQAY